jgi:Fe-S-cluster-containing dehydrogenase component
LVNFDLCSGCSNCQLACSFESKGGYNPRLALLDVKQASEGLVHEPVVCIQCSNPYCLRVCPVEAIEKDRLTGVVTIDQEKCNGCSLCAEACYLKMIKADAETNKFAKCQLCGGEPKCVKFCPTKALQLVNIGGGL